VRVLERIGGKVTTRLLLRVILPVLAIVTTIGASAPWTRGVGIPHTLLILVLAAVFAVAVPLVAREILDPDVLSRRWLLPVVTSCVWLLFTLGVVLHSPLAWLELIDGLFRSPRLLLSEHLPVLDPRSVLVDPVLLSWVAGTCAAAAARRSRLVALTGLLWVVNFTLAYAMTTGGSGAMVGWVVVMLIAGGAWLVAVRWIEERATTVSGDPAEHGVHARPMMLGVALLLVGTVAAAAVLPDLSQFASSAQPLHRNPPVQLKRSESPPDQIRTLRIGSASPTGAGRLFSIQVDRPVPGYVAVAELTDYTGATWSLLGDYQPAGGSLPPTPGEGDLSSTVTQHYQVDRPLGLPWMPYLASPRRVEGWQVSVSPSTGMIVPGSPLSIGSRFAVTSSAPRQTPAAGAMAPDADIAVPPTEYASLKAINAQIADGLGATPSPDLAYARQMADYFSNKAGPGGYTQSEPNASPTSTVDVGLTYGDASNWTVAQRNATPEQYATMMVLLARQIGIPARLVVGFRVNHGGQLTPGTIYGVSGREAWTWAEVPVQGVGWVPLDPTPATFSNVPNPPSGVSPTTTTTSTTPNQVTIRQSPLSKAVHIKLPVLAAFGLLVAMPRVVHRRRRRRRMLSGNSRERTAGAWQQGLDDFRDLTGLSINSMTGDEAVALTTSTFGAEAGSAMATTRDLGEVALYSPSTEIDQTMVDRAWSSESSLRQGALQALSRSDRFRAQLRTVGGGRKARRRS
jgi:hypothetical protein